MAVLLAIPGVSWLLGIRRVDPGAEPFPVADAFPYERWESVLERFVEPDGSVDYEGLAADSTDLRRFVATVGDVGPKSRPDLFPTEAHSFAWHINAYNAVTLLAIVEFWPNEGVHDISGPVSPKDGFGFFYGLRHRFDGRWMNTYDFENSARATFKDARLHAGINCASVSCPRLSREAYVPERLEQELDAATREFVSTPPHVALDAKARVVRLSSIFKWFADDFEAHAERLGVGDSVLQFIEHYAGPDLRVELQQARMAGWSVEYVEYDWSLNTSR